MKAVNHKGHRCLHEEKKEHHHIEGCVCEQCQDEDRHIQVTSQQQDGAVVISAKYLVRTERQELSLMLTVQMEALAARLTAMGGIIGHIKASLDIHTVEIFSITDISVQHKEGMTPEISVTLAAILFAVEEETAKKMVKDMLRDIDGKLGLDTV